MLKLQDIAESLYHISFLLRDHSFNLRWYGFRKFKHIGIYCFSYTKLKVRTLLSNIEGI